jgi:acetyl esterase
MQLPHSLRMTELDPKTRTLLDLIAAANEPPLDRISVEEFRARRERGRAFINLPPPELAVVRDTEVAGAEGPLKARIYDVEDGAARPALIYFHGGGFVYGDIESHDPLCRRLADSGRFRVISIDYRLAPEAPFPAAIDDAIMATRAIASQAERYGVDPARIAVGGDSAGANLATNVARNAARTGAPALAFQLLIYPVVQQARETGSMRRYAEGYFLTREVMSWFKGHYLRNRPDPNDERLSPLLHTPPPGLAPALVVTAGYDPLLDEGREYAEMLAAAGIRAEHVDYPDQIHGFFSFTAFSGVAADAIAQAARAVSAALAAPASATRRARS